MADLKYTKYLLNKLEDLYRTGGYKIRYERGTFKSGYCILEDKKVVVVNKFVSLETKINCFLNIIDEVNLVTEEYDEKMLGFYHSLTKTEVQN